MNDRMTPIQFDGLMRWALSTRNELFGVHSPFRADANRTLQLFDEKLETPFGPAAGPHTQLAQNIVAAYAAGARFFELKTVQQLDGEDLPVDKPCILAKDEGYNVEWSTELTVPDAFDEYVKAWFALKLLCRALALGGENGFVFNMSVGYDLPGIQSEKIGRFIEGLKDASNTPVFQACKAWAFENLDALPGIDRSYVETISPRVASSITLSTLHGCPPEEIERIATYLLTEKKLNTFVKLNPTLLGYTFARERLNRMGYEYLDFDDHHFKNDLQYQDALPMLARLMKLADEKRLSFGVKLTNTFPVQITRGELPGKEMYMSGRPLFALSAALAALLSRDFGGKLRISYSGGADALNISSLVQAGIWPVTVATTLLKPGGYQRLSQMAEALTALPYRPFKGVNVAAIERIAEEAETDTRYQKPLKMPPMNKLPKKVPLQSCFTAPCQGGCPIGQDVPEYIRLVGEGKPLSALRVIVDQNPLPSITGEICSHRCQDGCRRNFYEETIHIRGVKRLAAEAAMDALLDEIKSPAKRGAKVAVVGGGAAGLSAAYFLARAGLPVTLFEKTGALGGVVRHVIPPFRVSGAAIERDIALVKAMGVEIRLNQEVLSLASLRSVGYKHIIVAVGAAQSGELLLKAGQALGAIEFLSMFKADPTAQRLGKNVCVVGGGNTAMDAARAAKRSTGVESVSIVYRRDARNMPADLEELSLADQEGIAFLPLLSPISHEKGILLCDVMRLGAPDKTRRRAPEPTGETRAIPCDTVIAAIGEKVDEALYARLGIDENTLLAGDGKGGPATVVEAIADARAAANEILCHEGLSIIDEVRASKDTGAYAKKGRLMPYQENAGECYRCLECDTVCECCVDVCPNRANLSIQVEGRPQIVHIDRLCNACGNCETFCPYDSAPYKEKFTLFATESDFDQSNAPGLFVVDKDARKVRIRASEDVSRLVDAILAGCRFFM